MPRIRLTELPAKTVEDCDLQIEEAEDLLARAYPPNVQLHSGLRRGVQAAAPRKPPPTARAVAEPPCPRSSTRPPCRSSPCDWPGASSHASTSAAPTVGAGGQCRCSAGPPPTGGQWHCRRRSAPRQLWQRSLAGSTQLVDRSPLQEILFSLRSPHDEVLLVSGEVDG